MKKLTPLLLFLTLWYPTLKAAPSENFGRELLGIHLNLPKEDVTKRLQEIGTFVRAERKLQEVWQVRDESFSHLIIGFSKDARLRFITAVARDDKEAKRLPYSKIGDLKTARQAGDVKIKNFNYEWELPATPERPQTQVNARGRNPEFVETISLKRIGSEPAEEEKK